MAVIVASHLLGEIERVCTALVAIEAGRLLRSAPLGEFTEATGSLAIEVEEDPTPLIERLAGVGLAAARDGRTVLVALDGDRTYDVVRDGVAELGLSLVRVERRRHKLEDLFRDAAEVAG
jgi:ABC-2 type transport system ATP-binding protein